jgi:protein-S-isoprenylcysteine O-methyltransferase Ste14
VGCCLGGCVRLLAFTLWRAIAAALLAVLLTRVDTFVEDRHSDSVTGKAWRAYRSRGKKTVRRGTPPDAGGAIDTSGRPRP